MQTPKSCLPMRIFLLPALVFASQIANAQDDSADRPLELHGQTTYLRQTKPSFASPYSGPKSLGAARAGSYSFTATGFVGVRAPAGFEFYANPEVTQGVPFSQLQGTAGFTNGELARTSGPDPIVYLARFFMRKTWNFGGDAEEQASEQNQVKTRYLAERVVVTAGTVRSEEAHV